MDEFVQIHADIMSFRMTYWQPIYDAGHAPRHVTISDMPVKERRDGPQSGDVIAVGRRLKACREALGRSQKEVAQTIAVSRGRLAMWEIGKNPADGFALLRFSRAYRISMDFLFAGVVRDLPDHLRPQILARLADMDMPDPTAAPAARSGTDGGVPPRRPMRHPLHAPRCSFKSS